MNPRFHIILALFASVAVGACSSGGGGDDAVVDNSSSSQPPPGGGAGGGGGSGSGSLIGSGDTSFTLSWTPPTSNSDGSALTDLAGYKIRIGIDSGDYSETVDLNSPGISRYVVDGVPLDTYFVVMTSVNSAGTESAYSQEVAALSN